MMEEKRFEEENEYIPNNQLPGWLLPMFVLVVGLLLSALIFQAGVDFEKKRQEERKQQR